MKDNRKIYSETHEYHNIKIEHIHYGRPTFYSDVFPDTGKSQGKNYEMMQTDENTRNFFRDFEQKQGDAEFLIVSYFLAEFFKENYTPALKVIDYSFDKPKDPTKEYKWTKTFYANQLVSTYLDKFKCIALLKHVGTREYENSSRKGYSSYVLPSWKTEPNYYLYKDGEKIGKVLHFYWVGLTERLPQSWFEVITLDGDNEQVLRRNTYTDKDRKVRDILDPQWEGRYARSKTGKIASEYQLLTLQQVDSSEVSAPLQAIFGDKILVVRETDTDQTTGKQKTISWRTLQIIQKPDKNIMISKHAWVSDSQGVFTIRRS